MHSPIRIAQIGLGPLGQMLTPYLIKRSNIEIVSAVDIDPSKTGHDLGEVSQCGQTLGIAITDDLDRGLADADLAVVTTVSELQRIAPTLKAIIDWGVNIVSTCEELSYPWTTQPELSATIDTWAKERDVSVLGTGINPGFLMDFLPTAATGVCHTVQSIRIERTQDASARRLPFQQKIGAGLTVEEFQKPRRPTKNPPRRPHRVHAHDRGAIGMATRPHRRHRGTRPRKTGTLCRRIANGSGIPQRAGSPHPHLQSRRRTHQYTTANQSNPRNASRSMARPLMTSSSPAASTATSPPVPSSPMPSQ